jgi:hypothetical protein
MLRLYLTHVLRRVGLTVSKLMKMHARAGVPMVYIQMLSSVALHVHSRQALSPYEPSAVPTSNQTRKQLTAGRQLLDWASCIVATLTGAPLLSLCDLLRSQQSGSLHSLKKLPSAMGAASHLVTPARRPNPR